ncbi:mannose-1-phosphate guanylyltransferase [Chlamydiota bacterium]
MDFVVIMAGGKGERFWPKSRQQTPKQLLALFGNKTLLELTIERAKEIVPYENILVITNMKQQQKIREVAHMIPEENIIGEPVGKNTAPCIGLAAKIIEQKDPEGVMMVLPADHIIPTQKEFSENMKDACIVAKDTCSLIPFGISPAFPETGYGYIRVSEKIDTGKKTLFYRANGFFEKPDAAAAQQYIKAGNFFWNSGMFLWRCDVILEAFEKYLPKMYKDLNTLGSLQEGEISNSLQSFYQKTEAISIDYGVMEKAENVLVARADFSWDDVGSWSSLERHLHKDANGNVGVGEYVTVDSKNCIVSGQERLIATVGLDNMIIVDTEDALLVCDKSKAQDVKKIVSLLKKNKKHKKYL